MTITVGRLAVWIVGLVMLFVAAFLVWRAVMPGELTAFQEQASKICREEIPRMQNAPDLQTALIASAEMRTRLSALTPPSDQAPRFTQYLAALKASEDAVIAGNPGRAAQLEDVILIDLNTLGIREGCSTLKAERGSDDRCRCKGRCGRRTGLVFLASASPRSASCCSLCPYRLLTRRTGRARSRPWQRSACSWACASASEC